LRRRVCDRLRRPVGFNLRRRDCDLDFVGDLQIIHPRAQPCGVRLRVLAAFQQRQNRLRRLPQRGEIHDVIALKISLDVAEKLLRRLRVHLRQRVEKIGVEVFLRPLLRAGKNVWQRDRLVRRARENRCGQEN
jgi:hypothetical protein